MKLLAALCAVLALGFVQTVHGSETCKVCQEVAALVKSHLNQGTEKEVETVVEHYCATLPASLKDPCTVAASYILPQLFKMAEQELKGAAAFCTDLGLCPATNSVRVELPKLSTLPKSVSASPECVLCEYVIAKLDSLLVQNSSVEEIEAALLKVCALVPTSVRSDCDSFITKYAPTVLKVLVEGVKPSMVCTVLTLCTSAKAHPLVIPHNQIVCSVCTVVFTELDTLLKNNATEAEIVAMMGEVCDYVPSSMKDECHTMIKQYIDLAIDAIKSKTPTQACTDFMLCP